MYKIYATKEVDFPHWTPIQVIPCKTVAEAQQTATRLRWEGWDVLVVPVVS